MKIEEMRQRAREGIKPPPKKVIVVITDDGLPYQTEAMKRIAKMARAMGDGMVAFPSPRYYGKSVTMKIAEIAREMRIATTTVAKSIEDMTKSFRMADDQVDAMRLAMDSLNAVKGVDKPDSGPPKPTGPYWPHRIPVPASMAVASNRGRRQRRPVNSFA